MSSSKAAGTDDLDAANRIDVLCDEFEEQWRSGDRPRIEDFLGETLAENRSTLLVELVKVEAYYRQRAGEAPSLQEYRQRFPHDSQLLGDDSLSHDWQEVSQDGPGPTKTGPTKTAIGDFELLEMVGDGAFGCVWKARDRLLGRIVAVKLPRSGRWSETETAAFLHEAKAAAQLQHPNLVRLFGVEHDGETAFIVSEFVAGSNLKDWLRHNRPTFAESARLCATLARALEHAHAQGVVHRDLKPANIIVDAEGEPHITDFGLAKRLSAEGSTISGHHILGTPAYMSPEQAAGDSKHVDQRSDLYSLAGILYEMIAGQRVFDGDQAAVLRMVLTQEPVPPRRIRPEVPASLEAICLKGLAKAREDRYVDAEAFAEDLERFLRNEPVTATRSTRRGGHGLWTRRKFTTVALSAVPIGGYALWSGLGRRERKYRPALLHTNPQGAEVWFIPLNPLTAEPEPDKIIAAGRSPVELELPPGDYLVEAVLDEKRFHEVYRHVPRPDEPYQGVHSYGRARLLPGGMLQLPTIALPSEGVESGMARLSGARNFMCADSAEGCDLPPFLMDPFEVRCLDYKQRNGGYCPPQWMPPGATDAHALWVAFADAVSIAERLGKRLPDTDEYLFAASAAGALPPYFDGDRADPRPFRLGPVGEDPADRIDLDPERPIFGLRSNAAEWTIRPGEQSPIAWLEGPSQAGAPDDFRIVCGISAEVEEAFVEQGVAVAHGQGSCWCAWNLNGLGARCVRSVKPRLTAADFIRRSSRAQPSTEGLSAESA